MRLLLLLQFGCEMTSEDKVNFNLAASSPSPKPRLFVVQDLLSHLEGVEDCVPKVQMPASAFDFESGAPPHSALSYDSRQFGTSYDKDLKTFQDVDLLVEQGSHLCGVVYAFRSISRAIPTLRETKSEKYVKAFCLFIRLLPPPICSSFFAYFGGLARYCMASHCVKFRYCEQQRTFVRLFIKYTAHLLHILTGRAHHSPIFMHIMHTTAEKQKSTAKHLRYFARR